MIRIVRGPEPPSLTASRNKRLKAAVEAFNDYGPGSPELNRCLEQGYDLAKRDLYAKQHRKCAYCEQGTPYHEHPTEHFRPKKHALRGDPEQQDETRYWWLTWSWENLLFSCTTCNGQSHKGNRFPLASGSEPLAAPTRPAAFPLAEQHFDVTTERPLLLDPADRSGDPLDHLRWRPVDPSLHPSQWDWSVRGISLEGRVTVRILRLDERADFINATYRDTVWPRFRDDIMPKTKATRSAILAGWAKLIRDLVCPQAEFAAARWCMLDVLRTSSKKLRKLELPEPTRPSPAAN